ncbi:hypothetical protein E2C01_000517 [Portunus trituberculatus]|uniref:Uncharacterized protein n=1 Tax=Portunus trituberculatus TaxID=210409 RepID=A0A5B7CFG1_PORTR|nr:hypothetical protein [Portunus trituberculatus]
MNSSDETLITDIKDGWRKTPLIKDIKDGWRKTHDPQLYIALCGNCWREDGIARKRRLLQKSTRTLRSRRKKKLVKVKAAAPAGNGVNVSRAIQQNYAKNSYCIQYDIYTEMRRQQQQQQQQLWHTLGPLVLGMSRDSHGHTHGGI